MTTQAPYKQHPRFHVAVDCIIFGFDAGDLKLLIHRRRFEPRKGEWSLFGGFLQEDEGLDDAANRILSELTGLQNIYMEQLRTYGKIDRDPAGRVISVAFYALIPVHQYSAAYSDQYGAEWISLDELPELIMDHGSMVEKALRRLQRRAASQAIGMELLPEEFTIPQLQALHEAIYRAPLDKRNFRKKMMGKDILERLEVKDMSASKKGAYLYRFKKNVKT